MELITFVLGLVSGIYITTQIEKKIEIKIKENEKSKTKNLQNKRPDSSRV